jgi:hypothetical protein
MTVGKHADHESSIYRDAAGRWHGWVSMGGVRPDGKPDRRHVSARTRKDIVPKVRALENKRDAGVAHTAGRQMSFGEWLDHWLTISKRSVRPSTYVGSRATSAITSSQRSDITDSTSSSLSTWRRSTPTSPTSSGCHQRCSSSSIG